MVAWSTVSLLHHRAVAQAKDAQNCRQEYDDGNEGSEAAQAPTNRACHAAKSARKQGSMLKDALFFKFGHSSDEMRKLTKQLC